MVLVTGSTGLVGAHLLFSLVMAKNKVKAIYRSETKRQQVKRVFSYYSKEANALFDQISWIKADILDIPALDNAFKDVQYVYHAAALISFDPRDFKKLKKINEEGTANIVNLCLEHNIKKLCHVSSIGTIGRSTLGSEATEDNEWTGQHSNVYALTKRGAEMEVWRGSQESLPVVIVNPGVIIGPGFWNSGSGKLFSTANKGYSFYPPGGTGFVAVSDVVNSMIQLMESSVTNERFIIVAENLTYQQILEKIAHYLEKKPPVKKLTVWQLHIGRYFDFFKSLFTGSPRTITKNAIYSLQHPEIYNSDKIKNTIHFEFEPLQNTIKFSSEKFIDECLSSD